jgi:PAS domain S-box-containing protein
MTAPAPAGFAARAAALLEAAPVAALFLDPATGEILAGNAEAALLLECPADALAAAWIHALGENATLRQRLLMVEATEHAEFFDTRLARPAGPPEAVLVRARRLTVEGRVVLTIGLIPTIRRNRAEMALGVANRRLEVALAGADLGAWVWDAASGLVEVTPRWAAMLGLPPPADGMTLHDLTALIHPDDLLPACTHLAALQSGEAGHYEADLRMCHAAGHWVWVRSRARALERDAQGRALAIAGTHLDLTEQRQAAEARAASEREARRRLHDLESLYRTAPLGLAQMDRELRFVRINEALAEINGFPVEAHLGRRFWELVPDLREAAEPLLRQVIGSGEPLTGIELSGETAKAPGVKRDYLEQYYPVRDPETGEVTGVGIVCEEVTERRRADCARELLLRELDHRVKNLFAIITGLVSFTARTAPTPSAMRAALTGRIEALARAHDLVRPALGGALVMEPGGTVLEALAQALLHPFHPEPEAMADRLVLAGPPVRLGPTAAPPLALALHEMATNAAKYGALTTPEGQVALRWSLIPREGRCAALRMVWEESGGPPAPEPKHDGFGHRLVTQSCAQLGGAALFHWSPTGLAVELLLPLDRLSA